MGAEEVAAGDDADDAARIVAFHDRQAADVFADHVVGGFAEGVVGEDDRGRAADQRRGRGLLVVDGVEEVAAGDDADQAAVLVDDGMMPPATGTSTTSHPRRWCAGETSEVERRP